MPRSDTPDRRREIEAVLGIGQAARRPLWRRPLAWAGAVAVAAALAALVRLGSDGKSATRYVTDIATRGELTVVVTATGSVQPTKKVDVSSELSGTVRRVLVDYNTPVKAGQALAELDTDKLTATAESARARLAASRAKAAEAEATVAEKQRDLERKRTLAERQAASAHDLDAARAAADRAIAGLASARAEIAVAEAEARLADINLAKACICSPIDGVVLKRNVDPGQTVASSFQAPVLFSIAEDLKQMELQVDVDEADVALVRVGQAASFSVDAYPERRFPAAIREVRLASETVQGVVTYKAVLAIDNAALLLRPGMTATAEIVVQEIKDALLVANAAFRFAPPADAAEQDGRSFLQRLLPGMPRFRPPSKPEDGRSKRVWTLRDGAPVAVPVVAGASDGKRTQVVAGDLAAGQAVVIDAIQRKR
ncbi:MAG: efflux RND transporter periplasmic adaptor subunit [Alphaproteobacteria bacterium]|nr:efflux RND transporter periplasmic adaptor subunit [Alphaproteobacteria bacterium]